MGLKWWDRGPFPGKPLYTRGDSGWRSKARARYAKLKAAGQCPLCKRLAAPNRVKCQRCLDRQEQYRRKKQGWDGTTPWVPLRVRGGERQRSISCKLPVPDYERIREVCRRENVKLGSYLREAVLSYTEDICDEKYPRLVGVLKDKRA